MTSHVTFESEETLNLETTFVVAAVAVLVCDALPSVLESVTVTVSEGVVVRRLTLAFRGVKVRV